MFTWLKNRLQRNGLTAYITHPVCLQHNMGVGHPECPERLIAIRDQLMAAQIYDSLHEVEAPEVTEQQLARVHPHAMWNISKPVHPASVLSAWTRIPPWHPAPCRQRATLPAR